MYLGSKGEPRGHRQISDLGIRRLSIELFLLLCSAVHDPLTATAKVSIPLEGHFSCPVPTSAHIFEKVST